MKKYPLVVVEWDDVSSVGGWEDIKESQQFKPFRAKMVGWEIHKDRENIVITTALDNDGECNGRRVIPRGCIRGIRRIE